MRLPLIAIALLAISSAAFASSSRQLRGTAVFDASGCRHCHTIGNVGGHKGPDLSDVGRRKSEAAILQQVVNGSKIMPAFGTVLQQEELRDLIAYLRSCRQKPQKAQRSAASD
jgi:mono/diheme cytochrome c family protein